MYLRFPSGSGGYTTGYTDPELLQDVDWSKLKFMHWNVNKPPIITYMNINLCRKLGIKPCCFQKTTICEANRVTDCNWVTSAMRIHREVLKRENPPPMGFKRLRDGQAADKLRDETAGRKDALERTMCALYQQGKVRILAPSHKQISHHPNDCPVPLPVYSCHNRRNGAVPERKAQGSKFHKIGHHVRVTWGPGI